MQIDHSCDSMTEFVGCVDEISDLGENQRVDMGAIVKSWGVNKMDFIQDVSLPVVQHIVFDVLGNYQLLALSRR